MLYCEGTRLTPKKHQVSMQVAESKGLPKLKYHLLPRTKGFWVTVQNLRGTGELIKCSNMATSLCELDVCLRRRLEASNEPNSHS